MANHNRLLQAQSLAKDNYNITKNEASTRANPPEGQNINKRILKKLINEVGEAWRNYFEASMTFNNQGTFAEEDERERLLNQLSLERATHRDWLDPVEQIFRNLELADNPPVQQGLNAAQLLTGLNADIESKQEGVRDDLDNIGTSLNDGTIPLTKTVLESLKSTLDQVWTMVDVTISELYEQKTEEVPDQSDAVTRSRNSFVNEIRARVFNLNTLIASKMPEELRPAQPGNPNPQAGAMTHIYKEYHRDAIPEFKGKLTEYATFKKEWQQCVAPGRDEVWQLLQLGKKVPKECHLSLVETIAEAWEKLDSMYASPSVVSNKVIKEFLDTELSSKTEPRQVKELHCKLMELYINLKTVNQVDQLTKITYILDRAVTKLPEKYREKYMERYFEKKNIPGQTQWKILTKFLDTQVKMFEQISPEMLEEGYGVKEVQKKALSINSSTVLDNDKFQRRREKLGKCPICQGEHTYRNRLGVMWPSDRLSGCEKFQKLSPEERAVKVESVGGCAQCTSTQHKRDSCFSQQNPCGFKDGSSVCTKLHSQMLHGTKVAYVNAIGSQVAVYQGAEEIDEEPEVMLHMIYMNFPNYIRTVLFFDDGSSCSLITHKLAGFLGLKGRHVTQYMEVAGRDFEKHETQLYQMELVDKFGNVYPLSLMGIDKIASNPGRIDVGIAYEIFPHVPALALDRPHGEVGLLLGQDNVTLLPWGGDGPNLVGNLRVMNTRFGSGFVLGGSHRDIPQAGVRYTEEAKRLCSARFTKKISGGKTCNLVKSLPTFLEAEELGTVVPRRCERCVGCQRCAFQTQEVNRKEQEELQMMKNSLTYEKENQRVVVTYPFIGDANKLKENKYQVVGMATRYERKLAKTGMMENYNGVLQDYIDRHTLVPVSEEEIKIHKDEGGLINYIGHHGVEKDTSVTTPLRMVANSATKNCNTGPSVNDLWPKGPNSLSNLLKVLLRWRCYQVALVWDLSKAYHSIHTTKREKFLRLIVWRFGKLEEKWSVWGFDRVAFGDVPASVFLELVKELAGALGVEIDPETAKKIAEDGLTWMIT